MSTSAQYTDRRRQWRCVTCGRNLTDWYGPAPDTQDVSDDDMPALRCPRCKIYGRRYAREHARARYVRNRASGLCSCGNAPDPGYRSCSACRTRARAQYEARLSPEQRERLAKKRERRERIEQFL